MTVVQDPTHPTGVAVIGEKDKGGSQVKRLRSRKAQAALDLKVKGYPLEKIAIALGYPNGAAVGTAIERALETELKTEDKAALRQIAYRRLEQATRALDDKIRDPNHPDHIAAVNAYIKVIDRCAKLMGLDAPTEFLVTTPSAQEMQDYVDTLMEERRRLDGSTGETLEDVDVLDVDSEWVDDDPEHVEDEDEIPEPTED